MGKIVRSKLLTVVRVPKVKNVENLIARNYTSQGDDWKYSIVIWVRVRYNINNGEYYRLEEKKTMSDIKRMEIDEDWADSTIIEAGDFVFVGYCMKNEGKSIEKQIEGAFDVLETRLKMVGLSLESVVKMDCLFKNISDLNYLPSIIKNRFNGKYPTRKAYETKFIREGIMFQIDAIAYKK